MQNNKFFFVMILVVLSFCESVQAAVIIDGKNIDISGTDTYLYGIYDDRTSLNIEATDASLNELEITGNENLKAGINEIKLGNKFTLLVYKENTSYKKYSSDIEIKNNTYIKTANNDVISGNFSKLNSNKFVYDYVDQNGGLLTKYTFSNKTGDVGNFIPAIISANQDKNYYICNLPANVEVLYYLGDTYKNEKVYIFSLDADGNNMTMLKQMINKNGYIDFTTDGKNTLLIANNSDLDKETIKVTKTTVIIIEITIILVLLMLIVIRLLK